MCNEKPYTSVVLTQPCCFLDTNTIQSIETGRAPNLRCNSQSVLIKAAKERSQPRTNGPSTKDHHCFFRSGPARLLEAIEADGFHEPTAL